MEPQQQTPAAHVQPAAQMQTSPTNTAGNDNAFPSASGAKPSTSRGTMIGGVIILLILVAVAYYFMQQEGIAPQVMPTPDTMKPTQATPQSDMSKDAAVAAFSKQSSTDDVTSIEADLKATDPTMVDQDVNNVR